MKNLKTHFGQLIESVRFFSTPAIPRSVKKKISYPWKIKQSLGQELESYYILLNIQDQISVMQ